MFIRLREAIVDPSKAWFSPTYGYWITAVECEEHLARRAVEITHMNRAWTKCEAERSL
jgi:hypothetical protein